MSQIGNSEPCVPPSTRKLRARIPAVPYHSQGNDSSDDMSDNDANLPDQASQLRKNHPGNLAKNGATLTAKQKYFQEYHNLNRARRLEYKREHYSRNKERILAQNRKYRSEHKDSRKDYLARNKERLKEKRRKYVSENKEMIREIRRRFRSKNKEKIKELYITHGRGYAKEYYERNKERYRERERLYRSRKRQAKHDKNQRVRDTREMKKSSALQKMNLRCALERKPSHSTVITRNPSSKVISPVLKTCVVLLEKMNIPESSLKSVELINLGVSQTPRKPKLPKTITKKSFANDGCSKLAGRLIENRKNCILVESSEQGKNVQELIVKSDTAYLQKMFLEVEKMLGV